MQQRSITFTPYLNSSFIINIIQEVITLHMLPLYIYITILYSLYTLSLTSQCTYLEIPTCRNSGSSDGCIDGCIDECIAFRVCSRDSQEREFTGIKAKCQFPFPGKHDGIPGNILVSINLIIYVIFIISGGFFSEKPQEEPSILDIF